MPLSAGLRTLETGGRKGQERYTDPSCFAAPRGIGVSTGPDKADRQLRGDEFKGADVADGSEVAYSEGCCRPGADGRRPIQIAAIRAERYAIHLRAAR
jgi:hypothetical protein